MIRIAVVGDIGSGKSYVARKFGYPVFNADKEVSKIYKKNRKCYIKLRKALHNHITSFPVKKSELSKAIISNNYNLEKIIKIVHPEIRKKMNNFIKKNKNNKIVVLDIPLLIENNINKKKDVIVFVDGKKTEVTKRLRKRVNFNPKIVKILRKFQLPLEKKRRKSNFIIKNNFKDNSVKKNIKNILFKIIDD